MGTPVPQNYRDGTVVFVPGRVGVVVAPLTSAFIEVAGNQRDWDVSTFDSQGYRVVGGVLLEPGPGARVKGEAFVGYMHQGYAGVISLLSRTHIAVLSAETIVERPADLFDPNCLGGKGLQRNFVFVTGPSATADMGPLVRGVHGPHHLHIIILE